MIIKEYESLLIVIHVREAGKGPQALTHPIVWVIHSLTTSVHVAIIHLVVVVHSSGLLVGSSRAGHRKVVVLVNRCCLICSIVCV